MKILELIPSLRSGGAEQFVVHLSNQFSENGNDVILGQLFSFNKSDILSESLNKKVSRITFNKKKGFDFFLLFKLCQFIRKEQFDIVHSHTSATSYLILPVFLLPRINFFSTIHSEAKREAGGYITRTIRKIIFKTKKCIPITISEESNTSFLDFYKIKASIIYNGTLPYKESNNKIKTNPFPEKDSYKIFIHVARCHPIKNQEMLYKAVIKLNNNGHKVKLYHYGNFDDSSLAQKLYKYRSEIINICGETSTPRDLMKYADACCLTSHMEGMPMTIIESFSVSCPVISTPVGGCKNMIKHGSNGLLSDDTSFDSYYNTLEKFLCMSEMEKSKMKNNAYKSFSKYTIELSAIKHLELFKTNDKLVYA